MSIDATRWAWQQPVKANQKIVLLSLADRAGENHDCYPSIKRLAQDCGMSRSALFANLEELEKQGLIKRINRSSEKSGTISNVYQLIGVDDRKIMPTKTHHPQSKLWTPPIQTTDTPRPESGLPPVQNLDYPPSRIWTTPVQNLDTEPSINHQYINNNNNQKNDVKSVEEVLLSLDLKVKESEPVSPTKEKAERQKVKVEFPIFENFNLTESEKAEVNKKLASLSQQQRDIAIQAISTANMDDDIVYIRGILSRGMKGELKPFKSSSKQKGSVTPTPTQESLFTPVSDEIRDIEQKERASKLNNTRLEIIKDVVSRKKAELLAEFHEKKFVMIRGLSGVVIEPDLRAAGLFD